MNGKPEGAGYIESSVNDRYDSMKSIPSYATKHPDQKPIGPCGGTDQCYKMSTGALDK